MGQAWKAWDTQLRRNVTIKLPHNHHLAENDLKRFLRESEAVAKLSHPQLSSIYEMRPIENTFYIVARYVEGANLRDFVDGRQLSYSAIADLCAKTGDALQHAHDAGVIHRDLKPANIIVGPDDLPHIIDFGLAKIDNADHDLTMNGELLGTPAYMSPELASGHGDKAGSGTDIYSLGVILYELLTGRCPFKGSRGEVVSQIVACDAVPPAQFAGHDPARFGDYLLQSDRESPGESLLHCSRHGGRFTAIFCWIADPRTPRCSAGKMLALDSSPSSYYGVDCASGGHNHYSGSHNFIASPTKPAFARLPACSCDHDAKRCACRVRASRFAHERTQF